MRITKVYTRTGDDGKTRLAGGQRVWKDHVRVKAYGTVDELNAAVGVVRAFNAGDADASPAGARLEAELRWMQNKLFDVGGILATAQGQTFKNMPRVTSRDVGRLERLMDECQRDLKPLAEFLLPGGGQVASLLHLARTVCRRAERLCISLARKEQVDAAVIKFLNRLSDALFVLARWIATKQGEPEVLWERSPTTTR
jgi:cob(I)alamin adenosyltransferase